MANQLIFNRLSERWVNRLTIDAASGVSDVVLNRFFGYQVSQDNVLGDYSYFDDSGRFVIVYSGANPLGMDAVYPLLTRISGAYSADAYFVADVDSPTATLLPTRPSSKHVFNYLTHVWELPSGAKQTAADEKIRQLQDTIYSMQREPVTALRSDSLTLTSLYFATDHFRSMLANPERIGVDGMGGVRFWGADGYEHTVGITWFDNFNPLGDIYLRDKLLDTQLYDARAAVLALVADTEATVSDIFDYDPGFTMPSYPYA